MKITEVVGSQVDQVIAFLDSQPDDEVFTKDEIQKRSQVLMRSGSFVTSNPRLKKYTILAPVEGRIKTLWGNPTAILKLKHELEKVAHENQ